MNGIDNKTKALLATNLNVQCDAATNTLEENKSVPVGGPGLEHVFEFVMQSERIEAFMPD